MDSESAIATPDVEVIDGYLVDAGGEVVGLAEDKGSRFEVRDEDAANWVLKLKMAEEAKILAVEAQRAAINANLDGQLVAPRNRLKYLGWRFDNELADFARKALAEAGSRIKTLRLAWGSVAFRRSKGSSEILDHDAALAFVEEWAPDQVKKSANVGAVAKAIEAAREALGEEPDTAGFFRGGEPRESVAIKTGIGKD